ncbi:FAD-dependent oxidoreductase [Streptomyces cyaneofuscatus]|uniref:FAD-dependent oxidoreductase n=1 Tax=Streptomyces cyaneofuscatus TaxID=66883 RepID=UPI00369F6B5D
MGWFTEHINVAVIGGGQSGLATARALLGRGLQPMVVEASDRAAGSGRRSYDSLTLFSPARWNSLPAVPFPAPTGTAARIATRPSPTSPAVPTVWTPASASLHGVGRRRSRSPGAWPPGSCADGDPPQAGSTCVNIGLCRMCRSCRSSAPRVARVWCRAARR